MEKEYKYDAFISYRHLSPDKPIAEKLQKLLEEYVPPKSVNDEKGRKKLRLFRDESELPTSNDLGGDIKTALEQSRFLVVICSENFEKSKWCMQEVAYFQELHGGSNKQILTLYVGDPDLSPVFPDAIRFEPKKILHPDGTETVVREEVEPLAANVSAKTTKDSLKKLKTEFLRIAAPLFGCGFDDLYQREQRRRARRRLSAAAAVFAFLVIASVFGTFAVQQKKQINYKNAESLVYQSKTLESDGDLFEALRTVIPALPEKEGGTVPANRAVEQVASLTGAYDPELFTATKKIALSEDVKDLCLMNGGKSLLVITTNNKFSLWDTQTGELIRAFEGKVTYYHDSEIEIATVSNRKPGLLQQKIVGINLLYQMYEKEIMQEKSQREDAIFFIDGEGKTVSRVSPADGSVVWTTNKDYDGVRFNSSSERLTSLDGLSVFFRETVTDENGWSDYKNSFAILDPASGDEIAAVDLDSLEKELGSGYVGSAHYIAPYIILEDRKETWVFEKTDDVRLLSKIEKPDEIPQSSYREEKIAFNDGMLFTLWYDYHLLSGADIWFCCHDVRSGKLKWIFERSSNLDGGACEIGVLETEKGAADFEKIAFAVKDNEVFVIDPDSGKDLGSFSLGYAAEEVYFSDNGFVFVIDESGNELFFRLNQSFSGKYDQNLFCNHDFKAEINNAAYCNNVYAVIREGHKNEVLIYSMNENPRKEAVFGIDEEKGSHFDNTILSQDKSLLVTESTKEKKIYVVDSETREDVTTIKYDENSNLQSIDSVDFLNDKSIVANSSYKADETYFHKLEVYDVLTGKLTEEHEYDSSDCVAVSSSSNEIFVGSDETVSCFSPGREEETVFDLKEFLLRDLKEEDLPYSYRVYDIYVSPSGEKLAMFCYYRLTDEDSGEHMFILDRKTGTIVELREFSVENSSDIKSTVWSPDEDKWFLLTEGFIYAYECSDGEKAFEIALESRAGGIFLLDGKLCFSDDHGNLSLIDPKTGKEVRSDILALNKTVYSSLKTEFIPAGKNRGFIRTGDTAWLIDTKEFEIVFKVDNFSGYDPEKEIIYTTYYNYIYSYPVLSPFELRQRAESILN